MKVGIGERRREREREGGGGEEGSFRSRTGRERSLRPDNMGNRTVTCRRLVVEDFEGGMNERRVLKGPFYPWISEPVWKRNLNWFTRFSGPTVNSSFNQTGRTNKFSDRAHDSHSNGGSDAPASYLHRNLHSTRYKGSNLRQDNLTRPRPTV